MYISISFVFLYLNIALINIRARSMVYTDFMELFTNIPTRIPMTSFNNTNGTNEISFKWQRAIQTTPRIVQSVNKTIKIPRMQNPNAHGDQEFVSKSHAIKMNAKLLKRRDAQLNKYVTSKCTNASSFSPCSFMPKVYKILKRNNTKETTAYFNSLRYTPVGTVCEGCKANTNYTFFKKNAVNDLLIRKFIGNTETNEIYTVENRISFLLLL